MRMAANRHFQAQRYGLLAPPACSTSSHLMEQQQQQLAVGAIAATTSSNAEVIFSIGGSSYPAGNLPIPIAVGRTTIAPFTSITSSSIVGIAPISQSSSTSSSYGTTTSTTIALPLDTPLRYATYTTSSSSTNNFNHNFNNNLNTTSVMSMNAFSSSGALSLCNNFNNNINNNNNNADLASVDSSDTYASCQTHPFLSQGDLTVDFDAEASASLDIDMDNLYINPLEKESSLIKHGGLAMATSTVTTTGYMVGLPPSSSSSSTNMMRSMVKKSASGDTALRNLIATGGISPMDDVYQNFDMQERGSHVSLNENPVPKHRKTRFQQSFMSMHTSSSNMGGGVTSSKLRARFDDSKIAQSSGQCYENQSPSASNGSSSSKKKRSSFMPGKSLATATKIINQHLFGIQSIGPKAKFESKHSSSIDSIDASPNLEHHRRSKSILKNKSDISRVLTDPESERLLADNMSGSGVSDNGTVMGESGSDYSPNKLPHSVLAKSISPPPLRHRTLIQQRSGPATLQSKTTKFQTPRYPEEQALRQVKPMMARSTVTSQISSDAQRYDSTKRDSSLDSETTFTSNVNIRDLADDTGELASNGDNGGTDENQSLLQRDEKDSQNDGTKA